MRVAGNVSSTLLDIREVAKTAPVITYLLIIPASASCSGRCNWGWIILDGRGMDYNFRKTAGGCESSVPVGIGIAAKVILNKGQNIFVQNCEHEEIKRHLILNQVPIYSSCIWKLEDSLNMPGYE